MIKNKFESIENFLNTKIDTIYQIRPKNDLNYNSNKEFYFLFQSYLILNLNDVFIYGILKNINTNIDNKINKKYTDINFQKSFLFISDIFNFKLQNYDIFDKLDNIQDQKEFTDHFLKHNIDKK